MGSMTLLPGSDAERRVRPAPPGAAPGPLAGWRSGRSGLSPRGTDRAGRHIRRVGLLISTSGQKAVPSIEAAEDRVSTRLTMSAIGCALKGPPIGLPSKGGITVN